MTHEVKSADYRYTTNQQLAIAYVMDQGADAAEVGDNLAGENAAGIYADDADAIIAYGVMPNTKITGWYFAGYADDLARMSSNA